MLFLLHGVGTHHIQRDIRQDGQKKSKLVVEHELKQ
jgi:hypothetical protein